MLDHQPDCAKEVLRDGRDYMLTSIAGGSLVAPPTYGNAVANCPTRSQIAA